MSEKERIGIFLCECSKNISGRINVEQIKEKFLSLPDVETINITNLWCSPDGKKEMAGIIKNRRLTKVIIGACSVKQHEKTFMNVLEEAGLNPYLMQMVNIREHVAWVTDDDVRATAKASALLKAAYERVHYHQAFTKKEIDANADVVVIGAGLAGCEAALNLASKHRKVYLVDKNPSLGGQATKYESSFPALECCSCMIVPKLQEIMDNPNIEFLNYSDVEEAVGFFGNFQVTVNKKAKYVIPDKCIGCNACVEVCPVDVPNEYDEYLGTRKAIHFQVTGATPFIPVLDNANCLRFNGQECTKCKEACMFDAIDYEDKDEKVVLDAGAIVLATGFELFDPKQIPALNYSPDNNIYTSLQFERLLSNTGPTGGKLAMKDGTAPKSLVMVHCIGSRDKRYNNYCSNVCCSALIKMSTQILEENMAEGIKITHVYRDLTLGSTGMEGMYNKLVKEGVTFVQVPNPNDISINKSGKGLEVCLNGNGSVEADMVVLAPAMVPNKSAQKFIDMLMLSADEDGFFMSTHKKTDPVSTPVEGIFVIGSANYPKDITNAVIDGSGAAGKIMSQLVPGEKLEVETLISTIDEDKCSGCKTCIVICPYKAIGFDKEKGVSAINDVLCRGCGTCAVACPSSAITPRHFENNTILAELGGLL
ncbi:MAG: CoB--CoM heterodisulfide reductase iron-sulfur subunit A family protein [Candidatus Aminicenantes bacterium]|nr:CoB--CoM heterodisulfide reductase iron-sulfur subunit A family protein [Candidatus Aminicenantes bacterium]